MLMTCAFQSTAKLGMQLWTGSAAASSAACPSDAYFGKHDKDRQIPRRESDMRHTHTHTIPRCGAQEDLSLQDRPRPETTLGPFVISVRVSPNRPPCCRSRSLCPVPSISSPPLSPILCCDLPSDLTRVVLVCPARCITFVPGTLHAVFSVFVACALPRSWAIPWYGSFNRGSTPGIGGGRYGGVLRPATAVAGANSPES